MKSDRSSSASDRKEASIDKKELPKAGRYFDSIMMVDLAKQFSKTSSSSHLIFEAINSSGKKVFTKFQKDPDETYKTFDPKTLLHTFYQQHTGGDIKAEETKSAADKPEWPVPAFEAYMADLFRICHPGLSPNITVFYDRETHDVICHGSTELPGFKTNHSAPLGADKLFIGTLDPAARESRDLINKLRILSKYLEGIATNAKEPTYWGASLTSGLSTGWGFLKKQGNALYSANASGNFKPFIDEFIADKSKFSLQNIKEVLIPKLYERKRHIGPSKDRENENKLLDTIIRIAENLIKELTAKHLLANQPTVRVLAPETKVEETTIKLVPPKSDLDSAIDRRKNLSGLYQSSSGVKLTPEMILKFEQYNRRLGKGLHSLTDPDYELTASDPDRSITITVSDLINYRVIKGVIEICAKSFYYKEGDLHNENLSTTERCPARVDHDMTQDDISHHFKDKNILEHLQRTPTEKTYQFTDEILDCFPIVNSVYYWPTKYSQLSDSKLKLLTSMIANYERHLFRTEDNKVFQALAGEPVAIFHSYRAFLELILTPDSLIEELCKSQMYMEAGYKNKLTGEMQNLPSDLLESIKARKRELMIAAKNNRAFCNFMECYGDCAFKLIKDDFKDYKQHYIAKSKKEKEDCDYSYCSKIADCVNLELIEAEFKRFRDAAKGEIIPFEFHEKTDASVSIIAAPTLARYGKPSI